MQLTFSFLQRDPSEASEINPHLQMGRGSTEG